MDLGLSGQKAVVTGGTRGIGRAIVETLVAEGVSVSFCARNCNQVDETVAALSARNADIRGEAVDVTDRAGYEAWLRRSVDDMGGADIFIPNVSGMGTGTDDAHWRASYETDLMHTVRGVDCLLPALAESGRGAIIIIGTIAAVETFYTPTAYGAMKAALLTYAKQMGQAVAPHGVRINTVAPGPVYFEGGVWDRTLKADPDAFAQVEARCLLGRMATPVDVARAVVFLASPAAAAITGSTLTVDCGFTQRVQF